MKRVITEPCQEFTLTRDASTDYYYGIEDGEYRGFITKNYEQYMIRYLKNITMGYGNNSHNHHSFQRCLEDIVTSGYTVYEFNTHRELVEWLLEGK